MKTLNAPAHTPTNGTHALWNQSQKRKISREKKKKKEVMQMQPTTNKGFGLLFEMGCG